MALTATEEAQVKALIAQNAALLSLASSEPTIISKLAATKVSLADLTAASTVADSDLFLVRQGSTEKSVSRGVLASGITPPDASTTVKGIVELATVAEAQAGTDTVRALTAAGLSASVASTAIGIGQTWQDVTASRLSGTVYTNTTNRPICVIVTSDASSSSTVAISVSGNVIARSVGQVGGGVFNASATVIVPVGATYSATYSAGKWFELR